MQGAPSFACGEPDQTWASDARHSFRRESHMIRFVWTICAAAVGVAVAGSAAGAEQNSHAPAAGSAIARYEWPKQVLELLATIYGEKRKEIDIEDPFDQKCPQVTSLVSSVGDS